MSIRKILFCLPAFMAAIFFLPVMCFCSPSEIVSISQLNNPQYRVGSDSDGPVLERARENLPNAQILKYNEFLSEYLALQSGKIDAFTANESEFISAVNNGLENVRILPGYLGKPVPTAAGISEVSEIPGLMEKFNEFIAGLKADGTLSAMYKRWVIDNDTTMPAIDVPEKSDIHLTVGTTGTVMPFSFYINSDVTGFDIELGRRFAAHLGATVEFKIYGFGSILMALKSGAVDIALSNLYVTPETEESVKFSDIVFDINCVVVVRDDGKSPAVPAKNDTGNFEAFRGKRIGVPVGSIISEMVKEKIPDAQMFYFDLLANFTAALDSGKIDTFAMDEPVIYMLERENSRYTHYDGNLGSVNNAFIFPKSPKNNPLADEINEYIRRKKSDGTLDEIRALWFGGDDDRKIIPDYEKFPAANGTIRIALNNDTPPFSYIKDGRLAGYDVDVILRFCKDKGYRPDFSQMNFSSVLPAVSTGKCDMGIGAISISEERAEAVRFSEPVCSVKTLLLILKSSEQNQQSRNQTAASESESQNKMAVSESKLSETNRESESKTPIQNQDSQNAGASRKPKYSTFAGLDGKPIGMQPGIIEWEEWAAKNLPHSKIQYYNTYPDLVAALKTHKIEGLLIDFPVLALMAAEDNTLAYIDEPVGKPFGYSFFYAQTEAGKKLCDEMSEYIRKIKASGELDAILSKWQGADESAKIPPDFKSLPAKNGTLTYAAEGSYPPFSYYKGTELAGIDIDIAAGFCREYGYGLGVQMMLFDATIPAINSGKVDFAGDFTPSEEHEEAVYFSEPYCSARSVIACLKDDSPQNVSESYPSLAGKIIGVQTGTTCAELVPEKIPSAKLSYYDSLTDELTALKAGKADAICCSLPAAIFAENEDSRLTRINPPLRETYLYPIFARTEKGRKLCDEYSEFLKGLWDDGTIDALNAKWLGKDESIKTVDDYSQLPALNGSVKMAVDASMIPFAYVRDNKIVGYDIDLAVRFCKAKGYALEIENMTFTGVISSVKTGKCDFTQSMNKTPERAENTLFTSSPAIKSGNVLLTMKTQESPYTVNIPLSNFAGKRVGLLIGSDSAKAIEDKIPGVKLRFFDSPGYVLPALRSGRIDAFYCAVPTAVNIIQNHSEFAYIPDYVSITRHTTMFPKTGKGRRLCAEYADFLTTLSADGTLDTLQEKWITDTDESRQVTEDYSHLPAENGTLTLSVTEGMMPFVFVKDKRIQGYDIDLAVLFCKHKGCGLKIELTNHNGVLSSLETGKCDFSYSVQWTKERDNTMLFSPVPNAITGSILIVMRPLDSGLPSVNMKLSDFTEKKIGVVTGTNNAIIVKEKIPSAELIYYESPADILMALKQGKIDALSCGAATSVFLMRENAGLARVSEPVRKNYHYAAFVSSDKGQTLRREYGEFLQTLSDSGEIRKLYDKWILNNEEFTRSGDYSRLPSAKGTLKMAADPGMIPFVYMKDNEIIGYDIDLAVMFCKSKGYGLEVVPVSHSGVLAALSSGKCDFSYAMEYTAERAKSVLFSEVPNIEADNVLVVLKPSAKIAKTPAPATVSRTENQRHDDEPSFWEDVASSFRKTFIREERWRLFSEGILNTMIITVSAIFCGMLLGFAAFMFCRTGSRVANVITKFSVWLIKGTPIVVLLMILYYIVFGHVNISGIIVSIIAFTLTFGTSVYRMLTFGTGAVDRGQTEAAYALGFTDLQTFFTVILPQAALHFMPSFKEEVTMLIKSTSVVGYIAVQDLTKMGDIVRSRTYEAFFPLIAVAAIYFVLAGMLNIIVNIIHVRITPSKRKPQDILKGIDTARGNVNHD